MSLTFRDDARSAGQPAIRHGPPDQPARVDPPDRLRLVETTAALLEAQAELATLRARAEVLEAELRNIHTSTIWRVTRRLVRIVEWLRNFHLTRRPPVPVNDDDLARDAARSTKSAHLAVVPSNPATAADRATPGRLIHAEEGEPDDRPFKFVPHDGGFFSNFNFLVGDMHQGKTVYPVFCARAARERSHDLQHFVYYREDDSNAWFEFFEPIRYHAGDDTHRDIDRVRAMPMTAYDSAPFEFRNPQDRMRLYADAGFDSWRRAVHRSIGDKIRPVRPIVQSVERIIAAMSGRRIGVHVRHPSHSVEQGHVFFEQYFTVIDRLRSDAGTSSIFIATDNELALLVFKNRYPDAVFFHPGFIRESVDDILAWIYSLTKGQSDPMGFIQGVGFQTHYRIAAANGIDGLRAGVEAVTDVYTLAACDDFVCTSSNFTLTCSFLNPALRLHQISSGPI